MSSGREESDVASGLRDWHLCLQGSVATVLEGRTHKVETLGLGPPG